MRRTLEAIFRRPIQLLVLLLLLPLISVAVVYFLPRSYETTASLWAMRRYEIIGATGPESNLYASPAETQATALTEFLQTRAVALTIAKATNIAPTLNLDASTLSSPAKLDDALYEEISKNVQVLPQGYNLFVISYINSNPAVAQKVVDAVIKSYSSQSHELTVAEGNHLLESYQQQLANAKKDLDTAAAAEAQYIAKNPELSREVLRTNPDYAALADPQYALLHSQTKQAQTKVDNIRANITNLEQQVTQQGQNTDSLFKIIDPPRLAGQPISRLRLFLMAGGIGLGIALLACTLYVIILVRRDRGIYTAHDLHKVTNLPVVMQLPHLSSNTVPMVIKRAVPQSA